MKHIVVGTAGHIDHGKSALVEALTGIDPDRLKEEKDRGITIDLGFARYRHENTELAFIDVPGHERFVRNMLAGASGIDGVLLVIAADESVMPQTCEHLDICRLLGVRTGIVVLTKADLVDDDTLELVRLETQELVSGTFLDRAPILPVSSRTGHGLTALRQALTSLAEGGAGRQETGVPRIPIDRAFTLRGFGTIVTGTQVSGRIDEDTELLLLPADRRVKVRGVQVHGEMRSVSCAGQRVAINLSGIDVDELRRGDTLTTAGGLFVTSRLDSRVALLQSARSLRHGARVRFHQGTAEVMARVALGATCSDSDSDDDVACFPATLAPGSSAFVRLHLERAVPLTRNDRFVLRTYSPSITIAGGIVLDPSPPSGQLRSERGQRRLQQLNARDEDAIATIVADTEGQGVTPDQLIPRMGLTRSEVERIVEQLVEKKIVVRVTDRLVSSGNVCAAMEKLREAVKAFHEAHPLEPGIPREEARERLGPFAGGDLFLYALGVLVDRGQLIADRHLALATYKIRLSDEESTIKSQLSEVFSESGLMPPDVLQWAADKCVAEAVVDRMVTLLVRGGTLERVAALVFHRPALDQLKLDIVRLKEGRDHPVRLDVATFKERFGVTRKYAIPLLEYLDRSRVTRRIGRDRLIV